MVIEARSRIDTWQQQFLRRRARSVAAVRSDSRHTCNYTLSSMQTDKPMHIIGQSRVDTWQIPRAPPQASANRIIHRPIQIEGRSRVDTWQTDAMYRKRRRSPSPVRILASVLVTHFSFSFRSTDPSTFMVEVASTLGSRTETDSDARKVFLTSKEHRSTSNRKRGSIPG